MRDSNESVLDGGIEYPSRHLQGNVHGRFEGHVRSRRLVARFSRPILAPLGVLLLCFVTNRYHEPNLEAYMFLWNLPFRLLLSFFPFLFSFLFLFLLFCASFGASPQLHYYGKNAVSGTYTIAVEAIVAQGAVMWPIWAVVKIPDLRCASIALLVIR